MNVIVHDSIAAIARDDWNHLAGTEFPFLRHEFLHRAEASGCVTPELGWTPRHLTIKSGGTLRAAMPLYQKSHSWGEFVFDWTWAHAYEQAGLNYYPKLVSAVPFTPAPSRRLLLADRSDSDAAAVLLQATIDLARESECSSIHIQFPSNAELPLLREAGFLLRKDCQFHWHNDNYEDFDAFLASFGSAKRKKAKRDRRRVQENGISFRRLKGSNIDAETWSLVYSLISRTFLIRGAAPYFNEAFFLGIGADMPDGVLIVLAEKDSHTVAAAVFFESATTLYGRYWGSDAHYDALHFETCYYQGIDYCIENGLQVFQPGTQGEHKISRGFSPVATWSAHWLAHPQFAHAIEQYLDAEAKHIDQYIDAVDLHSPYKRNGQRS